MKAVFCFNAVNDLTVGNKYASGLGHAVRCVTIAKKLQNNLGAEVHLLIKGPKELDDFFSRFNIPYEINVNEELFLKKYCPSLIVIDINYLNYKQVSIYKKFAPVINLAPRGLTKFFSDITINDTSVIDVFPPNYKLEHSIFWYRGPEYSIIRDDFINLRRSAYYRNSNSDIANIAVFMGGVDQFNITGLVINYLKKHLNNLRLMIIASKYNPNITKLQEMISDIDKEKINFFISPDNIAEIIYNCSLGIFGTGTIVYESLAVGVPSINIGISKFHDLRGKELECLEIGRYIGQYNELSEKYFVDNFFELINTEKIMKMKEKGLYVIDGEGINRVINIISNII